jgi:PAS domain S-box-containing protein
MQSLRQRVIELERQLAEAQAAIQALIPSNEDMPQIAVAPHPEPQGQSAMDSEILSIGEAGIRRALYLAPYPLMIRRDDGQVVMINAVWTKISGYTREDIPTIEAWTRKASGGGASERKSEILNEGFSQADINQRGESEITTRSGEKRIWDFSTAPLGVDQKGRRLMMAMAVDVTDHNQVEEELRSARDEATWLARFPGENPNPVVRVSNEGIVLYCNLPAASLRGWGCAVNTALSTPLLDLVELAVEQGHMVEQDLLLGEKFYSVTVIPILEQKYLNVYGKDISERKQAEKALAESERRQREITRLLELDQARLAAILKYLPVGVWIVDEQGRLIGSNPEAERIWAGEALLDGPADYPKYVAWHPGSRELLSAEEYPITMALRTGETVQPTETNIRRFDGSEGTVLASAVPIKDGRGQLIGVVAVNVDITERKQAEEHIAYQARLLANVNDAIVGSDAEFRLTTWNAAAEAMYGWKAEEVLGQNGLEILQTQWPQEDANQMRNMIAESGHWRGETTQLHKSGVRIPVEVSSMVLRDERGQITGYVSVNRDITERKKAEQTLRESEAKYRNLFENMAEEVHFWQLARDEAGQIKTWRLVDANPPTLKTWGRQTVDEIKGKTTDEIFGAGATEHYMPVVQKIMTDGIPFSFEDYFPHLDKYFRFTSVPLEDSFITTGADITGIKKAQEELRNGEARLQRAQEIAHLGSWELDLVGNRLTWSDEVFRIFGLQPQEFGASYEAFLEAVHPQDRAAVDAAYSGSIREGRDQYEIEHRVVRRNGEIRIVHEKCEHFRDQNGQIIRSIGMVHDITERKKAEEQLRVYAQRLERSNRELEQFAFVASHDLQEPLRKIEMFGDMLLERATSLNDQERNYVDRMRNASGRMRDMVEGLLQLSRVTTQGKAFIPVDLSQVTSEVLHDLEGQIRRTGGRVNVEPLPTIEGDGLQLHELMQNLIGNALKYHQPGLPPEINVYAKQLPGKVQILVEDRGIGFEQEDAERIFQPFQRLVGRSQYEGSGMGLAICRRIVERHGGEIAARSQPGHGTTVIVTLPSQRSRMPKE